MAITFGSSGLSLTLGGKIEDGVALFPCIAGVAITGPCPVKVTGRNSTGNGQIKVARATGVQADEDAYVGYNIRARAAGQPCTVVRGGIVEGFAGATANSPVYIDATATPDPIAGFSGLTHTLRTQSIAVAGGGGGTVPVPVGRRIGVAISATCIAFINA